jgi:hypothetical protein
VNILFFQVIPCQFLKSRNGPQKICLVFEETFGRPIRLFKNWQKTGWKKSLKKNSYTSTTFFGGSKSNLVFKNRL